MTPIAEAIGQDKELKKTKVNEQKELHRKIKKEPKVEPKKEQKEQKPQVQQQLPLQIQKKSSKIEVEDNEEESYYPDDPDAMKVEKEPVKVEKQPKKLKTLTTFESKPSLKSFNTQSSFSDPFDEPSPIAETIQPTITSNEPAHQENEEFTQVRRVRKVPRERTYMDEKGYLSKTFCGIGILTRV